jgi:hypothetical protein
VTWDDKEVAVVGCDLLAVEGLEGQELAECGGAATAAATAFATSLLSVPAASLASGLSALL